MKVFASFEAYGAAWLNIDFGACAGIASDTGFARLDGEHTKAAQLDSITICQGFFHPFEYFFNGLFGPCSGQPSPVDYPLDQVLLDHAAVPFGYDAL